MKHRFILEPYNGMDSRFMCPSCRHRRNTFKRYIDTVEQTYLADHVGKCDRAESCGYHFTPREFFKTNPDKRPGRHNPYPLRRPDADTKQYVLLPWQYVDDSMKAYQKNHFITFLAELFGMPQALELARQYRIGTASHWPGATIFWQADIYFRIRTGKIMLYNELTGKRVKEPFNHVTWVHSLLMRKAGGQMRNKNNEKTSAIEISTSDFNIKQCFFGEHLLGLQPDRTVAIVESEKTAVIASIYHPEYIWIAAGSLEGLTPDKCRVLEGRNVRLYPDAGSYDKWRNRAIELNARMPTTRFITDDKLELTATSEERTKGIDIADRWIAALLIA